MSREPEVSVVICTYTSARWEQLCAAVDSIGQQTSPACEAVIVVDGEADLLQRARNSLPGVVMANRQQRGLSGARNTGVEAARGDVIAFLDDDAVADPLWLARLKACYADACVLGAGGAAVPVWQTGQPGWFPEEFGWVVGCAYRGLPKVAAPVRNLLGCNMSFRREVFDAVGGFRSGLGRVRDVPLGCEETEFCIRAGRRWPDGVVLYEPAALVYHHVPAGRATWRYFRRRCYGEGLSKAAVSRLAGMGPGLASERAYALRTLSAGVVRGLRDAFPGMRPSGLARSSAIVAGLGFTLAGYYRGSLRSMTGAGG